MDQPFHTDREGTDGLQVLWEDRERVIYRRVRPAGDDRPAGLLVAASGEHPSPAFLDRLAHELSLKGELEPDWSLRPLALERGRARTFLRLEDPGGEPLARRLGAPLELRQFLVLAIGIATALGKIHQHGLIHKDVKPAKIFVGGGDGQVRFTGFGIASRLSRERPAPEPAETIAGTLAYMAPEQSGRTNRSVDARSDLYALGVTFYEMLTGVLPFMADDPIEWVHCHVARTPVAPNQRAQHIPGPVSAIVMKLLAKAPEDRYQTAAGLERDLRRCLAEWDAAGRIDDFPLGRQDVPNHLVIPEKLYGRERAIAKLLECFDRAAESGAPELVLIAGYAGTGKSSIVGELQQMLRSRHALFAAGKVDQYQHDFPYATLVQAFQSLVRLLLSKSDAELATWRRALQEALEPNTQLMIDLVPQLGLILGDQPPAPDLPLQQAQNRFQLVFQHFVGVFARAEHPLVLFLDDLQWLDAATLDLLESLMTRPDLHHLLIIGAYRDNEVTAGHPLMRRIGAIESAGAKVTEIRLEPLAPGDLRQLIADTLRCSPQRVAPLAALVHEKTGGNPFFVIQFLSYLADEGLLFFDHDAARWIWNLDRIEAERYTDNVVELMVDKLVRLPPDTRTALQQLACLGNWAEVTTLAAVIGATEDEVDAALWPARRHEFVERRAAGYRFVHDRVHEAAYALIPEDQRSAAHLRIGRLLAAHTPADKREQAIFDIAKQLNRGAALIVSRDEREQLAEFNLIAGKRAKAASAYVSALNYFTAGAALLTEETWQRRHDLVFQLELYRAECEFLTGDMAVADERLTRLSRRAATTVEQSSVTCLRADLHTTLNQTDRAVAICLDYLRGQGIEWSPHPTEDEARREYELIWTQLGGRTIEELINLPLMNDPGSLATLDVLAKACVPARYTDMNLAVLVICRMVTLSLTKGNSDATCFGYVQLAMVAGALFANYEAGFRFGRLGYDLVEQRGLKRFQAPTYMGFAQNALLWTQHIRVCTDLLRRAFEAAYKIGDLPFATYSFGCRTTMILAAGDPLPDVQREAEKGFAFAEAAHFSVAIDFIAAQRQLVRTLRGLTPQFGAFRDEEFDEASFERHLADDPCRAIAACEYWIRMLQARVFAGAFEGAIAAADKARQLLWIVPSTCEVAEYHFYAALALAGSYDAASPDRRRDRLNTLTAHHRQIEIWARNCPETFENRAALVGAEIARIDGREIDAERLYERAIHSARANGFVNNEALASEFAARFHAARGFDIPAHGYLRNARYCYLHWGAEGKVRQLDALDPRLRADETLVPTSTIAEPVEHLDLATVIKVSQAISGEIVLEKLLEVLMRVVIEQAGAERGLLILQRGLEQRVVAEATTSGDSVAVRQRDDPADAAALPLSMLHYVMRTRETVVLDDAVGGSSFAADPYMREHRARSVLCLPLLNQAKVIGVLFLENNLVPRIFAPARIAVLKLLASQAAISLENIRLYSDIAEREARIRRLVESDVIGIVIWDLDGRLIDANDAFLRMLQYDRDDLNAGLRWFDMTPPEWQEVHRHEEAEELRTTGMMRPREKEYFRKDGSRVPVLIGAAAFEGQPSQGVAYILDLTERKRAEEAARESERRYREVQMELAHANRVATMGQLTGSIAHEVNQPIAATVTSAQAALRWLDRQPPNLEKARQSLGRIVRDGTRAGEVVGRIRDLIKKAPARQDLFEINGAIREVIELTRSEARKSRVAIRADLADGLPLICGDRVQLQQVMVNLIVNAIEAMTDLADGAHDLLITSRLADTGDVLVTFRDSGPGLDPVARERIFEAFFTTKSNGLGMGLSICRSIIEAHAGRLWASANEPRGAVFQFTLPAAQSGDAPMG